MKVWLKNNWKKVMVFLLVVGLLVWQPWQKWSISVADKEKVIDGNVRITGDLTVDGNETVKKNLDVDGQIKTKTDILAEGTIQGKTVQATKEVIAPEITTNKITTKEVIMTTKDVAITPVQTTSTVDQTGNGNSSTTTISTSPTISNYAETGKVSTPKSYTLIVENGNIGIVGGYNVNRIPNGVYRAYGPGTYKIDITDGFIYEVDQAHALAEFESRVAAAKNNGWACATIDYGPLK